MITLSVAEFAAKRRTDQNDMEETLYPHVAQAVAAYPVEGWYNDLLAEVARQYLGVFHAEGGTGEPDPSAAEFTAEIRATLDKTQDPTPATVDRISVWLSTAILNAATQAAAATDEEFLVMEWVTMHDEDVRQAHRDTEGQQRPIGEPYDVAGVAMRYPGDPVAPIELWINCRCTLAPLLAEDAQFQKDEGVVMTATETETEVTPVAALPWHGILAPEGVWSGDGRRFAENALRFRDLPLPLTWQKATDQGHDGSVVVGKIEGIERVDGMMSAHGTFLAIPEADEVVGLIAEFGRFGISVDADDAEFELDEADGKVTFTSARIASASVVAIPAFAEAFIALGPPAEGTPAIGEEFRDVSSEERKKDADAGRALPDGSYPIDNCSDLKNAIQAIGRAKDPAKTKAHIKKRKNALGCPDVDLPESWSAEVFADPKSWWDERGKGWLTNPKETKRIHDYWTRPGEEGYAKIGWGSPGDFNRCRTLVGEKIAENSPEDTVFLNEICAQWHHDALGIWPGEHHSGTAEEFRSLNLPSGSGVGLVAAADSVKAPAGWFADPNLTGPTHLTVTDEGRVFGHIATWDTCHIGYSKVCVAPPQSATDYAYFATGRVLLDDGSVARTGIISCGGGHAPDRASIRSAIGHYDSTSTAVADVCVGEDDHGIWCAGWVRPGATDEQVIALRASDVSGDWREIRPEQLELVAALAVNVGGFPTKVGIENGVQVSLVAAGMVEATDTMESLAEQIERRLVARQARRDRMRELAHRVAGEVTT